MILTDEEIKGKWHTTSYEPADNQISYSLNDIRDRILKAQLKKVKDELGRVLDEPDDKLRLALGYVWQALLEEVKE